MRESVRHVNFALPSVVALVVGGSIAEAYGHWFLSLILTVGAFPRWPHPFRPEAEATAA